MTKAMIKRCTGTLVALCIYSISGLNAQNITVKNDCFRTDFSAQLGKKHLPGTGTVGNSRNPEQFSGNNFRSLPPVDRLVHGSGEIPDQLL